MLTMRTREGAGARTFAIDYAGGPPPGGPYRTGGAQLLLDATGPAARPTRLAIRYFPEPAEFQLKLPMLARASGGAVDPFELAAAARGKRPAVVFEAPADVVAALPPGLDGLAAFERGIVPLAKELELGRWVLGAIELDEG